MHRVALMVLTASLMLPQVARADDPARDHHEYRRGRRALTDDWRDLVKMKKRLARFDQARAYGDGEALWRLDREVSRAIRKEISETRRELRRARHEARRDEVDDYGRPSPPPPPSQPYPPPPPPAPGHAYPPPGRPYPSRDVAREWADLKQLERIANEWDSLRGRMGPPALERKRTILIELTNMAHAEVSSDYQDMRQDQGGMR